jgi:hypothetical protein
MPIATAMPKIFPDSPEHFCESNHSYLGVEAEYRVRALTQRANVAESIHLFPRQSPSTSTQRDDPHLLLRQTNPGEAAYLFGPGTSLGSSTWLFVVPTSSLHITTHLRLDPHSHVVPLKICAHQFSPRLRGFSRTEGGFVRRLHPQSWWRTLDPMSRQI